MAKSKRTTLFTLDDGRTAVFNQTAFAYDVNDFAKKNARGKRDGNRSAVYRDIARKLSDTDDESSNDSWAKRVKQWYYGNNGPRELDDIYKLAEIMECEDRERYLKEAENKKEENKVESNLINGFEANGCNAIALLMQQNALVHALKEMKEKEVAYELYSVFTNLMEQYLKAELDVWFEYDEFTPEWEAALARFPKRLPVECAVHRAKMYLSKDTIMKAYNLLEAMFGPSLTEVDEPSNIKGKMNYMLSGFLIERCQRYDEYLEEHGIVKEKNRYARDDDWSDFIFEMNESWWNKLEEVFEEYFPD